MSQYPVKQKAALQLSIATRSEAGIKPCNEDAVGFRLPEDHLRTTKGALVAIADGVSTAEAGKEAAERSVSALLEEYFATPETWSVKHAVQTILTTLNRRLYNLGQAIPDEARGYISTLSLVVIKSHLAYIFHVGDSRVYHLRHNGDELQRLTRDHVTLLSGQKNYLIRAMGMDTGLNIDIAVQPVEEGDCFLLCTDGVHDFVDDTRLSELAVRYRSDVEAGADAIVEAARAAASTDNISCALARIDTLGLESIDDLNERLTRLPFPPELSPGLKIDGYEVLAEMFASSRSQIYRVRDIGSGEELVIKTPSRNYCDDPAYIERFIMEEWIGSRVHHPNVVRVIPPHRERQFLYYLMEKVDGESLGSWLKKHPQARPSELIRMVDKIAAGLDALHKKEMVHQDLKPGNILVTADGHIKIVDFGSVYATGIHEIFTPVDREVALGTLDYADPAYRFGGNTGIQGDIYSLGVVVYEMFTGHLPYGQRLEKCKTREDFLKLDYVPAHHHRDIIPLWFDRALEKAVAVDPARRYTRLRDFLHDLKNPNPEFLREEPRQGTDGNSLLFWKMLSFVLLGLLIISLLVSAQK